MFLPQRPNSTYDHGHKLAGSPQASRVPTLTLSLESHLPSHLHLLPPVLLGAFPAHHARVSATTLPPTPGVSPPGEEALRVTWHSQAFAINLWKQEAQSVEGRVSSKWGQTMFCCSPV